MKSALAIAIFLLLALTMMNGAAQIRNPRGSDNITLDGDHPLIRAYVIELKYLSPEQALQMLQGEGSRFKAFIPREITEINALPNSQKLLIQTTDPQAAIRLTQLISLIDQPGRLALQAILIILSPPGPEGERQPMPTADGNTPLKPEAVQTWVQSLIDNYRGSVVLFPDQSIVNTRLVELMAPTYLTEIGSIVIFAITPEQPDITVLFRMPAEQKITAKVSVAWVSGSGPETRATDFALPTRDITLVMNRTSLVSLSELTMPTVITDVVTPAVKPSKLYFLAITPKIIPPSLQDQGVVIQPAPDGGFSILRR